GGASVVATVLMTPIMTQRVLRRGGVNSPLTGGLSPTGIWVVALMFSAVRAQRVDAVRWPRLNAQAFPRTRDEDLMAQSTVLPAATRGSDFSALLREIKAAGLLERRTAA